MSSSIWSSLEIRAISMGFSYRDYALYHKEAKNIGVIVSGSQYKLLELFFDIGLLESNQQQHCSERNKLEGLDEQIS